MEGERESKPQRIRTRAVYRAGRLEFDEPVTPPAEGSRVLVEYESVAHTSLARHFGVLPADAAKEIAQAVEQDCERIDASEW